VSTNTPNLLRAELVEASVRRCLISLLPNYGMVMQQEGFSGPAPNVVFREAFPTPDERESELTVTTVSFGFSVDDGGVPAELGTTLTKYVHTITAWVFALEPRFGRKVAWAMQAASRIGPGPYGLPDTIPLLDFNADPDDPPQIDILCTLGSQVAHQGNNSIRPWDKYVWTTTINVRDIAEVDAS
jgi:hypothetical protein